MPEPQDLPRAPSRVLPALAAGLPTVFTLVACLLFGGTLASIGSVSAVGHHLEEMGGVVLLGIVSATLIAIVAGTILLYLAARGRRVPLAVVILPAALPWLAGVAGARYGMGLAARAIVDADPASRAMMMARGISEAVNAHLLGSMTSCGLLAAVALGLALGALGQRAQKRSVAGAGIGALVGLPLVALALWSFLATRSAGASLVLASFGALVALALAGSGIGADEPHGRSGALGAATPLASGLAVYAGAAAARSLSLMMVFGAMAMAEPASRIRLVAQAAAELAPLLSTLAAVPVVALLGAAALAGWSALRSRPSPGRIAGAIAIVASSLAIVGADVASMRYAAGALDDASARPWREVAGFTAASIYVDDASGEIDALVEPEGLMSPDGRLLSRFDPTALRAAIVPLRATPIPDDDGLRVETALEHPDAIMRRESDLSIAIDRRTNAASLRAFFDAASAERIPIIEILGEDARAASPAESAQIRAALPMFGSLIEGSRGVRAVVGGALSQHLAARDRFLFHCTVGASAPAEVEVRSAANVADDDRQLEADGGDHNWRYLHHARLLYIAIGDGATGQTLVTTIDRARRSGFVPVVVTRAIPGYPELDTPPEDLLGLGGN